ncbi:spore coat protein U domain-containing protein [Xylophilus sp. GW821-FHT01B05]
MTSRKQLGVFGAPSPSHPRRAGRLWRSACGAGLLAVLCTSGHAQSSLAGNVQSTITLTKSCLVVNATGSTGIALGTLDFGTRPATFTGQVTASLTGGVGGGGTAQVQCSTDVTAITISIDAGLHAGQGTGIGVGARAMANTGSYVPYDVFQNSGNSIAYPANTPVNYTVPTPGAAFSLPIYGLVNKTSTTALTPGIYNDTLLVTLTF